MDRVASFARDAPVVAEVRKGKGVTLSDELRQTFLFEGLTEKQLHDLARSGSVVHTNAGDTLFREGEPADFLWVLLEGKLELSRHVGGQKMILITTDRRGTYAGGMRAS